MKYSKQRELIKNAVINDANHPSAEEVYLKLKKDNPNLSLGTVYRNLNLLSDIGEINRLNIPNSSDRYEKIRIDHQHVICNRCGKIFDINLPLDDDFTSYVMKHTNVETTSVNVVVNGICSDCKKSTS